jgi:hypothetical protein
MKNRKWLFVISLALLLILQACTLPGYGNGGESDTTNGIADDSGEGQGNPDGGNTLPADTDTPFPPQAEEPTPTFTVEIAEAPTDTPLPSPTTICDQAGFVTDVTVPDGSKADPDEHFTKTWRLRNDGACTWTSSYDLVFSSGDAMGAPPAVQLTAGTVAPGETVDVSVELVAPSTEGTYKGFYKLRNGGGVLFGLEGGNPFWVEIEVKQGLILLPPAVSINYTAVYASGWTCATQTRQSVKIKNTGSEDLESMNIILEGPIGIKLYEYSTNFPFKLSSPPEPVPQCQLAGTDTLTSGNIAWVEALTTSPPAGGTNGRITIQLCTEESLGGACKEATINFTW